MLINVKLDDAVSIAGGVEETSAYVVMPSLRLSLNMHQVATLAAIASFSRGRYEREPCRNF